MSNNNEAVANLIFDVAIRNKLASKDTFSVYINDEYQGKLLAKDEWEAAKIYAQYTGSIVENIEGINFRCYGKMPINAFLERKTQFIPPQKFRMSFTGFSELMDGTDVVRD